MEPAIHYQDMLNIMDNDLPFNITFFTYNEDKQTGGEKVVMTDAVRTGLPFSYKDKEMRGIKKLGSSAHPIAIHARLITRFNGMRVIQ